MSVQRILMITALVVSLWIPARDASAQTCPSGTLSCSAGWCCPPGTGGRTDVCCNSNPQSMGCTSNGNCSTSTNDNNNDTVDCSGASIPTQDHCGESSCSCAATCDKDSDCASDCCYDGFCALPCTCASSGTVTYNCGTPSATTKSPNSGCGGCASSSGEQSFAQMLPVMCALAALFVWRRRPSSQA